MDEFIQSAMSQLGLDESVVRNVTGNVLGFFKEQLGDEFASLADKLPGADQLIASASAASPAAEESSGLLGNLAEAASGLLGEGAGGAMDLWATLKQAGLSTEQGGSLLQMLLDFVKQHVDESTLAAIAEKIPALKSFLA